MNDNPNKPAIATTVTGSNTSSEIKIKKVADHEQTGLANMPIKDVPFIGSYMSVREAYENSPWFRDFFFEIFEMYGCPVSILGCITQKDKIMLSWAILHATAALKREPGLWVGLFEVDDPIITADFFCRTFFEKRKQHVIPALPLPKLGPDPAMIDDADLPSHQPKDTSKDE